MLDCLAGQANTVVGDRDANRWAREPGGWISDGLARVMSVVERAARRERFRRRSMTSKQ
jgi:hypothetical protein